MEFKKSLENNFNIYFNHHYILKPIKFEKNAKLKEFFTPILISKDKN